MSSLPLVFDAPRRGTPPRHLADVDPADRAAVAQELGVPRFRLDQLARHWFGRLTDDLDTMNGVHCHTSAMITAARGKVDTQSVCPAPNGESRKFTRP